MAPAILPLGLFLIIRIGMTVDLRDYDDSFENPPIYDSTQYVQTQINDFNASYYVLPDEKIPLSKFRAPVDMVLGVKSRALTSFNLYEDDIIITPNFDQAAFLVIAECKTIEQRLKENAKPLDNWQNSVPKNHTHYVDKLVFGGKVTSLVTIQTNVTGDAQIIRRILKEVMGSSGRVGPDIVDLWEKALKTIRASPDVRGKVEVSQKVVRSLVNLPPTALKNVEELLKIASELPEHVVRNRTILPLYKRVQSLHDLDKRFVSLQKNVQSERYIAKLNDMLNDLETVYWDLDIVPYPYRGHRKYYAFMDDVVHPRMKIRQMANRGRLSMYADLDVEAVEAAIALYKKGLDNTTENYNTAFKRIREEIAAKCENSFLNPTRGQLKVNKNEVLDAGEIESLEKCQDICLKNQRCRAVGYSEEEKKCVIYYRSTSSATIYDAKQNDMKIYDLKCNLYIGKYTYIGTLGPMV